tara:strand:+ start:21163 stop:21696 length:534 start_codon:yes stop_codon:yes gene_type:complete
MMFIPASLGASGTAGEDVNPSDDDVPFSITERDSPSVDGIGWDLTIVMSDEAFDNGTTFEITTQICTNDGVCDPPLKMDATVTNKSHSVSVTPPSDHTYINWRVKAIYSDDSYTNFPQGDWYTTWSSCYFQQDSGWGGDDYVDDACASNSEESSLPGFGLITASASIAMAAILIGRD